MSGVKVPSVFGVVFESLLTWGAYASLVYFGLHVSALLVGALASITQNTIISANLALFEAKKNTSAVAAAPSATPMQRPSSPPNTYVNRTPPPSGMWACSYCGTQNKNNYSQCKKCGNYR